MGAPLTQKNKNIFLLAVTSMLAAVLFSFLGAPLLRALFVSAKARVFWFTGFAVVAALFVAGLTNYEISQTAVYVGAMWMTLGAYSELEKRGVNWRGAGLISLSAGLLFALAGYFLILKNLTTEDVLANLVQPLEAAITKAFPDVDMAELNIARALPGVLLASLFGALAAGLALETKAVKMFKLQRERVVSGLRWLDFRLPDSLLWAFLAAAFVMVQNFTVLPAGILTVATNIIIFSTAAMFFQGLAVVEFILRFSRSGLFMRTITYLLIILQLAPFVVLLGLVDYWADFRKLVRKKAKTN